jgi:glycosyltransferase involved in cell wall biosynthesis
VIPPSLAPKVSVIIPTWNRAKTLPLAISSVLKQSFSSFEILICDDGSTDNTEEIVRGFNDPRIVWIAGYHSGCPAVPRNRGLALSKGEWIAFLDSDDYWLPEKLEVQLEALKQTDALAVCSNAYRNTSDYMAEHLISWNQRELTFYDLLINNRVVCSSMLINRAALKIVAGFPEDLSYKALEDYCLWLKVSQLTSIIYLDQPLLVYKDDPKNSIRANGPNIASQRRRVFTYYLHWQARRRPLKATIDLIVMVTAWCLTYSHLAMYRLLAVALNLRRNIVAGGPFFQGSIKTLTDKKNLILLNLHASELELIVQNPLVSVLLPVNNSSAYLRQAINSILNQTYQNFELIVVDDGSTDGSKTVLDDIVDQRIVRVTRDRNLGIVAALNTGLTKAQGKYIARMDADDMASPDRLSRQVDFLNQHLDVAFVGSWIRCFGNVIRPYIHRYPINHFEIASFLLFENPIAHPSVMIRREMMDQLMQRYSPNFPFVEDWELWSRLILVGKAANIPKVLLHYRIHSQSSNHRSAALQKDSKQQLLARMFQEIGLPFKPAIIIESPEPNARWLWMCYSYFREILQAVSENKTLSLDVLAAVLQNQLILRMRQLPWFGIYPAWFAFRYRLVPCSIFKAFCVALGVFINTNIRAIRNLFNLKIKRSPS